MGGHMYLTSVIWLQGCIRQYSDKSGLYECGVVEWTSFTGPRDNGNILPTEKRLDQPPVNEPSRQSCAITLRNLSTRVLDVLSFEADDTPM